VDEGHAHSDEALLAARDAASFERFYVRHVDALLGYFARRTRDAELAADLTAETFAAAMVSRSSYKGASAAAWLFAIAHHKLADYQRRGSAESRMRTRLGMEPVEVTEDDAELIRWLGDDVAAQILEELPPEQRDAIRAHVLEDQDYAEIAHTEQVSEVAVRKRVSRGLKVLRERAGGNR